MDDKNNFDKVKFELLLNNIKLYFEKHSNEYKLILYIYLFYYFPYLYFSVFFVLITQHIYSTVKINYNINFQIESNKVVEVIIKEE
jgi:hypothetical protein